jgi:O-antigen ligase
MMLFATFSRGAMAAIILTPFFFALIFQKWPFRLRLKTYLAMAVLAFVIFIGLYNLYQTNMKFEAFINFFAGRITNVGKEKSATSRLDFMEMGSAMADDNLFGHGPKQFIWQTINYSYINRTSRGFAPHNDYVALLVDSGIFGLFFWLLFVALLLRSARARLQSLHTENPRYWYLTAAILSFLVFLLQGLTLDLFYSPHVWLNISIMLALIYGEYFEKREIGRC